MMASISSSVTVSSGDVPGIATTTTNAPDALVERILQLKYKWSGTIYELSSLSRRLSPWTTLT